MALVWKTLFNHKEQKGSQRKTERAFLGVSSCSSWFKILVAVSIALPTTVYAGAIDSLRVFVEQTQSARAQFSQQVVDRNGRSVSESSGTMAFSRPGKFRWAYQTPYEQLLVGDGQKLWIYDKELNQVTVKTLGEALGGSPAALLAGDNEIERFFSLSDGGVRDGLHWLEAVPRSKDTTFEFIRMGFAGSTLKVMELKDNFGSRTVIRFDRLERNPRLGPDHFRFTPPKGADVIGE